MKGIKLRDDAEALCFTSVSHRNISWETNSKEENNGKSVVLTVAAESAEMHNEPGYAKVTPLSLYPPKGRATGGVRVQKFLKGQNALVYAYVGSFPLHATSADGHDITLPPIDMQRDGTG